MGKVGLGRGLSSEQRRSKSARTTTSATFKQSSQQRACRLRALISGTPSDKPLSSIPAFATQRSKTLAPDLSTKLGTPSCDLLTTPSGTHTSRPTAGDADVPPIRQTRKPQSYLRLSCWNSPTSHSATTQARQDSSGAEIILTIVSLFGGCLKQPRTSLYLC